MPLPIWLIPIALKGAAVVAGTTGVGVAAHGAKKMKETILANCVNKVIFGNALPEDLDWWQRK